jgi:hypothetical protein
MKNVKLKDDSGE